MEDKEILFQMIFREVDKILANFNPAVRLMAEPIKGFVYNFLDPYVSAFFNLGTTNINTEAASTFIQQEATNKIADFVKDFEKAKKEHGNG